MKRAILLIPLFVATAAIGPCDPEPLGSLLGGHGGDAGAPRGTCAPADCDGLPVPAIACAVGETHHTCTADPAGRCYVKISCDPAPAPDAGMSIPPSGPTAPTPPTTCDPKDCEGQPVLAIACAVGDTKYTCQRTDPQAGCHWQISCPGSSPPACAAHACDGLPVISIGCAVGPTEQACVPGANGQCGWQVVCPAQPAPTR